MGITEKTKITLKIRERLDQMMEALDILDDDGLVMGFSKEEVGSARTAFIMEGRAYIDAMFDAGAITQQQYDKITHYYF